MHRAGVKITAGKFGISSVPLYSIFFEFHLNFI